jgi:aminocarboxymuconate-semialdehyde decarboxylase
MLMIDIHSHVFPDLSEDEANRLGGKQAWLRKDGNGKGMIMADGREFRPVRSVLWDMPERVDLLDRQQIVIQIVCNTPILFGYDNPLPEAVAACRHFNDKLLSMCAVAPARLKAMCQVPLQDTDAACAEVERAMADGHVGVQIGNHVGKRDFDDEGIVTFLHHCADIGAPVFVHPWDMMRDGRMKNYMLPWLVSMPAETQLSILSLILSGAFERLPASLKICFAHGGGSFAYLLGRIDNAWQHRDIVRKDCPNLPSSYVNRFHVDSITFDEGALDLLVKVMGRDQVMLGSDQPFPLGEQDVGNLVKGNALLSETDKKMILHENAERFFDLRQLGR